jgi:hypothetical protein
MSPAELFAHPWSQAVTLALLHFVWQGALIAALLAAAVELLRIRSPQARYACSLAALLLMAACPVGTATWQLAEGRVQGSGFGFQVEEDSGQRTEDSAAGTPHSPLTTHSVISSAQPYVLTAWLVGVAFFGCRLLCGLVGLRQLRRDSLPMAGELAERVDRLGRGLGMRARKFVKLSGRVTEAMAVGLLRPIVLIPASWATEMPPDMLEAVIAHELAHLRRQDLWINLLQRVVETLLFYHPAVWWLSRRLRAERELCCDELAVAATGRRLEYVQALEHVARQRVALVEPLLTAGIRGERNMRLLQRVRNVLGLSAASERSLWPAGLLALALPLGAWGYASGLLGTDGVAVVADDEREEKEVRKEGEREVREEKEIRKDGEAKEVRRDGDRPVKEGARDGDKKPVKEGARDGDVRKEGARDGDRPVKEGARDGDRPVKEGARDGDRPIKEKVIARDGDRPVKERVPNPDRVPTRRIKNVEGADRAVKDTDARMNELLAMVKKLTMENERLKAELAEMRGGKEREGFYRVREGEAAAKEAAAKERAAAIREKEAAGRRAAAEKEEAIARERKEGAERKEIEIRERKIKEGAIREGDDKEAAVRRERELIEKKRAALREKEVEDKEAKDGDK